MTTKTIRQVANQQRINACRKLFEAATNQAAGAVTDPDEVLELLPVAEITIDQFENAVATLETANNSATIGNRLAELEQKLIDSDFGSKIRQQQEQNKKGVEKFGQLHNEQRSLKAQVTEARRHQVEAENKRREVAEAFDSVSTTN